MQKIFKWFLYVGIVLLAIFILTRSCGVTVHNTTVVAEDSIRHYYPVLQGQVMTLSFNVANTGDEPLVLTDIQPDAGCISVDGDDNNVILPHKYNTLKFKYNTAKITGLSTVNIYLYGNIVPDGLYKLTFDVNVVPPYNSSPDYESTYIENERMEYLTKGFVNGFENEKGYYVNKGEYPEEYSRNYDRYPWRADKK